MIDDPFAEPPKRSLADIARTVRLGPHDDIPSGSPADYARDSSGRTKGDARVLSLINPADWDGLPIPEREWIVPKLIPARTVSMLSGDGATGKSLLGMQLCVARAIAADWIGTAPVPGRSLFLSAEDDADEMHRRLEAIRSHYGVGWHDLATFA